MNINTYLLPVGGAILGYLVGDKETAVRNAIVGVGVGLAANYFMKPAIPMLQEDLPPESGKELVVMTAEEGGPEHVAPNEPIQQSPNGDSEYVADTGENSDWIGQDPFPVGAVARFAVPLQTGNDFMATCAVKTEMGHWVAQPGQEEYWTSIGKLARDNRVRVLDVIDQTESTAFWSPSDPQPLSTYP